MVSFALGLRYYLLLWSSFLGKILFLDLGLLFNEVVLLRELLVKARSNPRKFKLVRYLFFLEAFFDFVFEGYELVLHLRVDVPVIICGPKTPESITYDIAISSFLLHPEYVLSQLQKDILSLHQRQLILLLLDDR